MIDATQPGRSSDFIQDLGEAVRKNPISAALIGMGAVWLFTNRSGQIGEAAQQAWQGTTSAWRSGGQALQETGRTTAEGARERGSQALDHVSEVGNELATSATEYMDWAPETARNILGDARANLGELFRAQPLALGAVGLAIGAAVAASLPSLELESAYLGESSDYVKRKANEIVGQQAHHVVEVGKKVADAVAEEAHQQGLTVDGIKATASEFSHKVSRVADAATKPLK